MANERAAMEELPNYQGWYARWEGVWYRVGWSGRTRDDREMVKLHTLANVWPDKVLWVPVSEITKFRKTRPPETRLKQPLPASHLDEELTRRLNREE